MSSYEQVLADLIHDLRQPLSNIETSAYCLDLSIDPHNLRAQKYLQLIQQQVDQAVSMLSAASAEMARARTELGAPIETVGPYELASAAAAR
jgi:signal transduction histidine kinase